MNESELYSSIKEQISPVYLLYGQERYSIEKAINVSKENLSKDFRELNFNIIDSDMDIDVDMIINCCEALPFMDKKRVIVIKNSDLFQAGLKNYTKEQIKKLTDYLETPSQSTILIFLPSSTKIDKKNEIYKTINKKYVTYQSERLNKVSFSSWVSKKFDEKNLKIDKSVKDYFIEKSGYLFKESNVSLLDVESEIEKLTNTKLKEITCNDIDLISNQVKDNDVFKFIDYVFSGEKKKAFVRLKNLLNSDKAPILIISLLGRQISILLKVYTLRRSNFSQENISSYLNMHPFVIKKSINQLKNYTFAELLNLYNLCSDMDYRIKRGQIRDSIGLEVLVNKICNI